MSILDNLIEQEQLTIRECFTIENGAWHEHFRNSVVDSMHDYVMDELVDRYGWNDPTDPKLFPAIVNDVPGIVGDYFYDMGHITKARRDGFALDAVNEAPFWGVPEVPQFSIPIRLRLTETSNWIRMHVSNTIWENQWKGIDPIVYDKFIKYMHLYWQSSLQFCHNPNAWKTLQDVINNPQDYEYLM